MAATPRKNPASKKPAPLTLKGSKLEDFLPLLPAEEKLRHCAASGEDCVVDNFSGERPEEATKLNTVRAEFLRYMILGGCERSPISHRGIIIAGAFIKCKSDVALEFTKIELAICLAFCHIDGIVNLQDSETKSINLQGSKVEKLIADGINSSGPILLRGGFESTKELSFVGGRIIGNFELDGAILNGVKDALACDEITVNGNIFLRYKFKASGKVSLIGAKINGSLECTDGYFGTGLVANNLKIHGNINLTKKFITLGTVELSNAEITGNLYCEGGSFNHPNNSIIANRAKIDGDVDLEKANAKGTIALTGTQIGGDFTPQGAVLEGTPALQLRNSKIDGTLIWRSLGFINGEVDFSSASCKTINTDGDNWMRKRDSYHEKVSKNEPAINGDETPEETQTKKIEYNTKLDNFTYEGFSNLPDNCKPEFWIEFLNQQPQEHLAKNFKPRPWEQLASVLDSMGYQEEALELRIEKQKLQTNFMANHEPAAKSGFNLWHWGRVFFRKALWGPLVGYGYKPGNALVVLFGLVMFGTLLYSQAAKRGIMTPTHPLIFKEARAGSSIPAWCAENWVYFPDENCVSAMPSEYSEFQSFIYAADVALPVVNLRMESDWAPRVVFTDGTRDTFGWWVRFYEWFLIAAGWILSLLFVSAVGSSIRK